MVHVNYRLTVDTRSFDVDASHRSLENSGDEPLTSPSPSPLPTPHPQSFMPICAERTECIAIGVQQPSLACRYCVQFTF